MARHMRPEERDDHDTLNPRSASDLLREAGYDLPDTRRRRRRDRHEESSLPPPPERMMFPYRRETRETSADRERAHPAPPASRPAARTAPPEPRHGDWAGSQRPSADLIQADHARAGQIHAEQIRAEQARAEQARVEQIRVEQARAELARVEQARAEQARVELARAEQARAEQVRAEQVQVRAEQARLERAQAERAHAERVHAERAQAERARAQRTGAGTSQRMTRPPAGRWLPDQTGPQTGPHTWPPLAPVPDLADGDLDEPTHGGSLRRLPGRERAEPDTGRRSPGAVPARRPSSAPARTAGSAVAAPKRAVQPEYDDRQLDRPAGKGARSRSVEPYPREDTAPERRLLRDWAMFFVETLLAAALGLGLWLGFHILWGSRPLLAAAGSGLVLVGLHVIAGWVRRRQTGADLDLLTSAVVVAVGVAITVLPAAFTIHPG